MPIKRRAPKRRIDPAIEVRAWAMTFRTGYDYLGSLPKLGVRIDARHQPSRSVAEDAWRRLGPVFLAQLEEAAEPWAQREFGIPVST